MTPVPGLSWRAVAGVAGALVAGQCLGEALGVGVWVAYAGNLASAALQWLVVLAFARGDPPRRAWLLLALGTTTVLLARVVESIAGEGGLTMRYVLLVVANVIGPLGQIALLRVVRRSGLVEGARGAGAAALWATGATAIAIAGVSATQAIVSLGPTPSTIAVGRAMAMGASATGDAIGAVMGVWIFALLAPAAGGALARPYLLLGTGSLLFLVLDLLSIFAGQDHYGGMGLATTGLGALAWAMAACAALCQLVLLREQLDSE